MPHPLHLPTDPLSLGARFRFWLRTLGSGVWIGLLSVVGCGVALFRWGDIALDYWFAHQYSKWALRILGFEVEIQGAEYLHLPRPTVIVGNHQSALDVPLLAPIYPKGVVIIGKKELLWIPFFGLFFRAAGNILIDRRRHRKAVGSIQQAARQMRERQLSVWLFPEGTRNRTGEGLLPFRKGAFHLALEAGAPVLPIVVAPLQPVFDWKRRWMARRARVQIRVLPPVDPALGPWKDPDSLCQEVRSQMSEALKGLRSQVLGWALLVIFGMQSCSSAPRSSDRATELQKVGGFYYPTLQMRNPESMAADPAAEPGEKGFQSQVLPDARWDCTPASQFFPKVQFESLRSCLRSFQGLKTFEVRYLLDLKSPQKFKIQNSKDNPAPACLLSTLSEIPVPREIVFQTVQAQAAIGGSKDEKGSERVDCYAVKIPHEEELLLGLVPMNRIELKMVLPLSHVPEDGAETLALLGSWALAPFWKGRERWMSGRLMPDAICRKCIGPQYWIDPSQKERPELFPQW